jgi:hypothetical protein
MKFFFDAIEGDGAWARLPEAPRQQLRDNAFTLVGQVRDKRPPYSRLDAEQIRMPTLFIGGADTRGSLPLVPRALAAHVPDEPGRPPFVASDAGRTLAREGQAIYAEIGRTLDIVEMTGGATDASFANRSGKAIVVESFVLAGFGYHARDEYIDTSSIVPRLSLMTRMLTELGKKK